MHLYSFEKVQDYLDKETPFNLPVHLNENLSVKEVILDFFEKNTEYDSNYLNGDSQCTRGRRRSMGDIYIILKQQGFSFSLEEIYNALIDLAKEGQLRGIQCCTIFKRVWFKAQKAGVGYHLTDEYGFEYPSVNPENFTELYPDPNVNYCKPIKL